MKLDWQAHVMKLRAGTRNEAGQAGTCNEAKSRHM